MSWAVEVIVEGGEWRGNQLRFATRAEADDNADDLMRRWPTLRATRVVRSSDPANLAWSAGELTSLSETESRRAGPESAVVIASGRSVLDVCLPLLTLCGAQTVAVNQAVRFAPFADYAFSLDTTDLEERLRLPGYRGQRVAAVPDDHFRRRHRRSGRFRRAPKPSPDIRYLNRIPFTARNPEESIMTGCSGFGALQFAYKFLGAKEVFLLGCDHDDQGMYFYGEAPDERHARNWRSALKYWNALRLPPDVKVWNASKLSRIESFPKLDWRVLSPMLGLPALPVLTVLKLGGEYDERHVEWLQRQVGFPILCLTDSPRPMRQVVSIPLIHGWPGWWSKMEMFRDDLCLGNFLYVDLDTVILRGIPEAFRTLSETRVLSDLYGHPWIQSCLMFLHHSSRPPIWQAFSNDPAAAMQAAGEGGDQIFLDRFLHAAPRLDERCPSGIISFKADVLRNRFHRPERGSLETARFVCFHGQPRPWDVRAAWIPSL